LFEQRIKKQDRWAIVKAAGSWLARGLLDKREESGREGRGQKQLLRRKRGIKKQLSGEFSARYPENRK